MTYAMILLAGSRGWCTIAVCQGTEEVLQDGNRHGNTHAGCSATCTEKPMQDLGRISLLFLREFHKLGKNVFLKRNKHQIIHIWQNAILTRQSDQ